MSTAPAILRVMFIDAGPSRSAWVIVEVRGDGSIVPMQGGWCAMSNITWLAGLMASVWAVGGVVGLEYINGALYDPKRWYDLCETLRVEGDIRTTAKTCGAEYVLLSWGEMRARRLTHPRTLFCVPASSWRLELLQKRGPKDAEIEVVVRYLCGRAIQVRPGCVERVIDLGAARDPEAYEHIVDALGGAVVMASVFLSARFKIPDAVRADQLQARQRAMRGKSIKRSLDKIGAHIENASMADGTPVLEELKKRRPSRGTAKMRRVTGGNTRARKR